MDTLHTIYKEILCRGRKARINRATGNTYDIIVYDDKTCEGYTIFLAPGRKLSEIYQIWNFQDVHDCGRTRREYFRREHFKKEKKS